MFVHAPVKQLLLLPGQLPSWPLTKLFPAAEPVYTVVWTYLSKILSQRRRVRKGLFYKIIDRTMNPILHQGMAEIQQVTQMQPCKSQVG